MRALILNCTLKSSPEPSNTEALLNVVAAAIRHEQIDVDVLRIVDYDVKPGVTNDEGDGDEWPQILEFVRNAQILVIATPTWLGQPSSVAKRVLEEKTGRAAASNLVAVARALAEHPMPAPPR